MNCPTCGHDTLGWDQCGDYCHNPNCTFDNRSAPETQFARGSDMDLL